MKNKQNIIKVIKICIFIVIIIVIIVLSLSYTINNNNNYKNNLINNIKKNYTLNDDINYINFYDKYYIITTKDKVIVLDDNYKEIYKEELSKLAKNTNNYDLIYKNKKLMYVNTINDKNKITYEYYDIKNYKRTSEVNLER